MSQNDNKPNNNKTPNNVDAPSQPTFHVDPGIEKFSTARKFGELLALELRRDPHFYFFSPDETTSNKMDAVYQASSRLWDLPIEAWDLSESDSGRIVEMLSENALFAAMVGHIMNGEPAAMTSYEAFFAIIYSQLIQQIKFFKQSENVAWRPKYPAINLLSTSMCWRQDHNGFSHQSPVLISALLAIPSARVNCLFPVDDIAAEATWAFMMNTHNVVNLATFDKNETPRWIDPSHAAFLFEGGGASIFQFTSDEDPELIFTAAGDVTLREAIYAMRILREHGFEHRMRFVGINSLTYNAIGTTERQLTQKEFDTCFGKAVPIIANFHGYPDTFKHILAQYTKPGRISAHGFVEEGGTTTPFEMLALNHASRYDLAIDAAEKFHRPDLVAEFRRQLESNHTNAIQHGTDLF